MDVTGDDLAGVVDLFGGLTREELGRALVELAFKRREDTEPADFDASIDAAVESYHVVAVEPDDGTKLYVPGPVAFPTLPEGATDLPHILDVEERSVPDDRLAGAAESRFQDDLTRATAAGDTDRLERLLDVSYELELWAPVDLEAARDRLRDALS